MIIAVGDTHVYYFPNSTIECRVHNGYIEVFVRPEHRRFIVRPKPETMRRLQDAYPDKTYEHIATTLLVDAFRNGFIQAHEEIL